MGPPQLVVVKVSKLQESPFPFAFSASPTLHTTLNLVLYSRVAVENRSKPVQQGAGRHY